MSSKLTVFFTSDTHGYLFPTNFHDLKPHPMGLLSMRFPKDENTLIIDGGDTIQGSPLTYYCRTQGIPLPVARALNDRGYDFVTLGNHDFNQGRATLADYLEELDARCLCANVHDSLGRLPIAPYAVREMGNGLRVGLIGIVTDWVNRWEKPENLMGLTISDPLEAARKAVAAIRDQVDVLIGIYHGGIEKDLKTGVVLSDTDENIACRICEELPFDLLLTGHQHLALVGREWSGTWIVQTPPNAEAYIRVDMDGEKHFSSELCLVPEEAELSQEEKKLLKDLNVWLDKPVGHLSRPIMPSDHLTMALQGSEIADFFNRVQLHASGAQISCASLANRVNGFHRDVSVRDVVTSYVYSNTLVVLRVTGKVLRQGLEQCASFFDPRPDGSVGVSLSFLRPKEEYYNYDYFAGISYVFDLNQPVGRRVTELTCGGVPVEDQETYSLVMCDYRASGTGNFEFYRTCPHEREILTDVSELILDELSQHKLIKIPDGHPYRVILPEKVGDGDT